MRLLTRFITASEYIPEEIKSKLRPYYHKLEEKLLMNSNHSVMDKLPIDVFGQLTR